MSSQHASIEYRDGSYFLRDLRSANGTFVNGKRMSDPDTIREALLKPGDRVRFDAYEFIFNLDAVSAVPSAAGGATPEFQRTVLRRDAPAQQGQGQKPQSAVAPKPNPAPAPTIQKPAASPNAPAGTFVRNEFCPTHSSWKATELCVKCGVGKCKQCMVENAESADLFGLCKCREKPNMKVALTVVAGPGRGRVVEFTEPRRFIIGRAEDADYRLPKDDRYVCRRHPT